MLLIVEDRWNDINTLVESSDDGRKNMFIEGVFLQQDIVNNNNRLYPEKILLREVNKYNEKIKERKALGELKHPEGPTIDPDRVSHRIVSLDKLNKTDYYGKALVLNTPCGNIVRGLLEGDSCIGVSSRGLGSLKENKSKGLHEVQDDYTLRTVDIVIDPSAPGAFVNGVMEGAEWIYESDSRIIKLAEKSKTNINKATSNNMKAVQIEEFRRFLNHLTNKF